MINGKTKIRHLIFLCFCLILAFFGVIGFLTHAAKANEADLKAGKLGPEIKVGIREFSRSYLRDNPLKVHSNKAFDVIDKENNIVTTVQPADNFSIKYVGDKKFIILHEKKPDETPESENESQSSNEESKDSDNEEFPEIYKQLTLVANDGNNEDLIFELDFKGEKYNKFRGKIRLRYAEIEDADDKIWVINILPLEQYVWGMGEMTGTGPREHNKVMTTIFRTYGYWKIKYGTKYASLGFKVNATSGDQIYRGYQWEIEHPNIRKAAEKTAGKIVMYEDEIALTAYHSWNDGKTRRYEDGLWNGKCQKATGTISLIYPYLSSIKDKYGKKKVKTCDLAEKGNHMVGLTANGSFKMAKKKKNYEKILKHYYRGVSIRRVYD